MGVDLRGVDFGLHFRFYNDSALIEKFEPVKPLHTPMVMNVIAIVANLYSAASERLINIARVAILFVNCTRNCTLTK